MHPDGSAFISERRHPVRSEGSLLHFSAPSAPLRFIRASRIQRKMQNRQRRQNRRLRPQNQLPERSLHKPRRPRRRKLRVRPHALRPNRNLSRTSDDIAEHIMNRRRVAALRKQNLAFRATSRVSLLQRNRLRNLRRPQTPRLLRRLQDNPLPTRMPLRRRRNQNLIRARSNQRRDFVHAQLRSLLQTPLKPIKFHQRDEQMQMQPRLPRLNRLNQRKFHTIVAPLQQPHAFHARQPHPFPIAQFVKLTRLGPQHPPQMLSRIAAHSSSSILKFINEKSSSHRLDCIVAGEESCNYRCGNVKKCRNLRFSYNSRRGAPQPFVAARPGQPLLPTQKYPSPYRRTSNSAPPACSPLSAFAPAAPAISAARAKLSPESPREC